MTTLFSMNINSGGQLLRLMDRALIACLFISVLINTSANAAQANPEMIQVETGASDPGEQEGARHREIIAEAFLHEKLKMKTDVRDLNNDKRAAGEILGFDVFLGTFLTALWAMISLFIATQFSGAKDNGNKGVTLFYVSASFVPLILLWVAISSGYASWWLTLAVSGLVYWLMGFVFKKIKTTASQ